MNTNNIIEKVLVNVAYIPAGRKRYKYSDRIIANTLEEAIDKFNVEVNRYTRYAKDNPLRGATVLVDECKYEKVYTYEFKFEYSRDNGIVELWDDEYNGLIETIKDCELEEETAKKAKEFEESKIATKIKYVMTEPHFRVLVKYIKKNNNTDSKMVFIDANTVEECIENLHAEYNVVEFDICKFFESKLIVKEDGYILKDDIINDTTEVEEKENVNINIPENTINNDLIDDCDDDEDCEYINLSTDEWNNLDSEEKEGIIYHNKCVPENRINRFKDKIEYIRKSFAGVGTRKAKIRLNKLNNINSIIIRKLIDIEEYSTFAKIELNSIYKDKKYNMKEKLIKELADIFKENNYKYGIQNNLNKNHYKDPDYIIYFKIMGVQLSFHFNNLYKIKYPKFDEDWDNIPNSTFSKLSKLTKLIIN